MVTQFSYMRYHGAHGKNCGNADNSVTYFQTSVNNIILPSSQTFWVLHLTTDWVPDKLFWVCWHWIWVTLSFHNLP